MEFQATFKNIRRGPRKLRLVVDGVRGATVQKALDALRFDRRVGAEAVSKLIRSALANATQKGNVRVEQLFVKSIQVNQAGILKRFTPRARGSSSAIQKKLSHITVVLEERI